MFSLVVSDLALSFCYIVLCSFPLKELLGCTQYKAFLPAYICVYGGVGFSSLPFLFFSLLNCWFSACFLSASFYQALISSTPVSSLLVSEPPFFHLFASKYLFLVSL